MWIVFPLCWGCWSWYTRIIGLVNKMASSRRFSAEEVRNILADSDSDVPPDCSDSDTDSSEGKCEFLYTIIL